MIFLNYNMFCKVNELNKKLVYYFEYVFCNCIEMYIIIDGLKNVKQFFLEKNYIKIKLFLIYIWVCVYLYVFGDFLRI